MMSITVLLHLLVTLSFSFSPTYCAPHTSITAIQEQLNSLGYSAISSQNNFESSSNCEACQATLKFQNSFQAVWLLKRHTGKKNHQIKAGWILDEENNIKMSRPKGENFIIFITWLFVKSIDSASRSVMLADGRPFESFKTGSMHEFSTFWKTFRFLEVSEWLVPASSFGFFCSTKVKQEKRKFLTKS